MRRKRRIHARKLKRKLPVRSKGKRVNAVLPVNRLKIRKKENLVEKKLKGTLARRRNLQKQKKEKRVVVRAKEAEVEIYQNVLK